MTSHAYDHVTRRNDNDNDNETGSAAEERH